MSGRQKATDSTAHGVDRTSTVHDITQFSYRVDEVRLVFRMVMQTNQQLLTAFFEDLARAMDYWIDTVAETVADPRASSPWMEEREPFERLHVALDGHVDDLRPVLAEGMRGLLKACSRP